MISLSTALDAADIFWPAFVELGGCVLLAREVPDPATFRRRESRTGTESFVNHVHLTDLFDHDIPAADHPEHGYWVYDEAHPDFGRAWELGSRLAETWAAKLRHEYPHRRFRLYLTRRDTPVLRFHQLRPDEAPWASADEITAATASGDMLVIDTAPDDHPRDH